ncbi:MAG: hypothetical protein V4671_28325 [Armatimonadota bacterium]
MPNPPDNIDWPFEDPKNLAVVTTQQITSGDAPILYVFHDEEEGDWQFLDCGEPDTVRAAVVSLYNMTQIDPSLFGIADLPLGWEAWRETKDSIWHRGPVS